MKLFTFGSLYGRRCHVLLLFIFCSVFAVQGQYYSQGRFWEPNPQVYSFIKYTDLSSVDYYTGTINVDIPFYTYKDSDFEVPVSFSYSSNGYRPNIPAGPVGMGWFINAGGFITREVRGEKDEAWRGFYKWYKNGDADYSNIQSKGTADSLIRIQNPDETNLSFDASASLYIDTGHWRYWNKNYVHDKVDAIESEPDIFSFNFFGHKGRFNMGPSKKVFIYATNHPSGEYSVDLTSFPSKIIIKTGDGYKYTFEKTNSKMGRYGPEHDSKAQDDNPLLYWPLTNIKAPNGREIIFSYTEPEKSQKSTPSYYSTGTSDNTTQTWTMEHPFDNYDYNHESEIKEKQEPETEYVVQLKDIRIGDFKIDFNYVPRTPERIYYKHNGTLYNNSSCATMSILNSVDIINTKNNETIKHADFKYTSASGNPYQFLKSIEIDNVDKYEMSYTSIWDFPLHGTTGVDHFGFFNNRQVYDINDLFAGEADISKPEWYPKRTREPSFEGAVKGMLSELKYPTGGMTKYYYEANDYASFITKDPYVLLNQSDSTRKTTGGVRVKRITDYSSPTDSTYRNFDYSYYDKRHGTSSGIKLHTLRYAEKYDVSYTLRFEFWYSKWEITNDTTGWGEWKEVRFPLDFKKRIFVNMKNSNGIIPSTRDKSHIEYPEVVERRQDGTCIVYGFTSYKTVPDISSTFQFNKSLGIFTNYNPDYINDYMKEYNDYSHQRGKPTYIREYDAGGKLVKETKYKYATGRTLEKFPTIRPSVVTYYYDHIIVDDYPLIEIVKSDYLPHIYNNDFISKRTTLSYNGKKQVISEETTFENYHEPQKWILNKYQYVADLPSSEKTAVHTFMENNNIVKNPIKTQTSVKQTETSDYRITQANRFDYEAKTVGGNNMVNLSKEMETANDVPVGCADFGFDNYLYAKYAYKYNNLGQVIEVTDRGNTPTSYLWGYNGIYIVALIENVAINDLKTVNGFEGVEDSAFEEGIPDNNLQQLYEHNTNSAVTTFYYKPYIGLTKMIAPTQRFKFYEYDSAGRLIKELNDKNEPVSEYEYNIVNTNN